MTQLILAIQATLLFINVAIPQLNFIDDIEKSIAAFVVGAALAFIGPFIPKVSMTIRRTLGLGLRTYG